MGSSKNWKVEFTSPNSHLKFQVRYFDDLLAAINWFDSFKARYGSSYQINVKYNGTIPNSVNESETSKDSKNE